mmetsp:Transcript_6704/g.28109  ORF Transcript_6704/g.28109 Transcript_6704/m.28109 type:complete len:116 (-) Transcript_6704:551-898(-)
MFRSSMEVLREKFKTPATGGALCGERAAAVAENRRMGGLKGGGPREWRSSLGGRGVRAAVERRVMGAQEERGFTAKGRPQQRLRRRRPMARSRTRWRRRRRSTGARRRARRGRRR